MITLTKTILFFTTVSYILHFKLQQLCPEGELNIAQLRETSLSKYNKTIFAKYKILDTKQYEMKKKISVYTFITL